MFAHPIMPEPSTADLRLDQFREFRVLSLQFWRTGATWSIPTRSLGNDWFFLLIHGHLTCDDGQRFDPGQIYLVPRGERHAIRYRRGRSGSMLAMHAVCTDLWGRSHLLQAPARVHDLPAADGWRRQAEILVRSWVQEPVRGQHLAESWLLLLLASLRAQGGWREPTAPELDPRVQAVIELLRAQWRRPPSMAVLARHVGLSPARLRALCQRDCGCGPQEIRLRARLAHAEHRLRTSNDRIDAIAADCGYASSQHFAQDFKRRRACSPTAFRRGMMP